MAIMEYDLGDIVRPEQELRKVNETVDFAKIARKYIELKTEVGKCLFLQFYYKERQNTNF